MKARVYALLMTVIAALGLAGPDLLVALEGVALPRWLAVLVRVAGFVVALCANGRAVPLVNLIFRVRDRRAAAAEMRRRLDAC